jgi:CheY-like chemotaxis protein
MAAKTYFYHYVTARIGADCPHILQALRSNLYHLGCRDIEFTDDLETLRQWVADSPPDLLVVQSGLGPDDAVCDLFRDIRHGDLGRNPFVPLVAITRLAVPELIKNLVNAGTDDVLPFPWPEAYLDQRLQRLIHERKPFVVTSDYVGPDRRGKPRPSGRAAEVTPIMVPNPLRAKCLDRMSDEDLGRIVAAGAAQVRANRIHRLAELVVRLVDDLIVLAGSGRQESPLARTCLERLEATTTGILRRAPGSHYEAACMSCRTLNRTARVMLKSVQEGITPELHLLQGLGDRFAGEFGIDGATLLAERTRHAV